MSQLLDNEGVARWRGVAAAHVGPGIVPGLVALLARGDEVHIEALGVLGFDGRPVRPDSLFRIASTTKPVAGAAVLSLVDEGKVSLDQPIDPWLPELANRRVLRRMDGPLDDTVAARRPITVGDLLRFTFGFGMTAAMFMAPQPWPIVAEAEALHLCTLGPPRPAAQPDPDTWMAALGRLPLIAQPGERWLYNTGASVLGVLASRVAEQPLAEVLAERLFAPLGMDDTSFSTSELDRLATAYVATSEGLSVWDEPGGQWSTPPAFCDGAAGLLSTAEDLLRFARMLLAGGDPVLTQRAVSAMTSDQLTDQQRQRDTLGFLEGRSWGLCQSVVTEGSHPGAFGWDGGLGTSLLIDPHLELTMIVLTQRLFDQALAPAVHRELQEAAYAAAR